MKEYDKPNSHISSKLHMICISSDNDRQRVTVTFTTLHYTSPHFIQLQCTHTHTCTHVCVCVYIYMCVCVCEFKGVKSHHFVSRRKFWSGNFATLFCFNVKYWRERRLVSKLKMDQTVDGWLDRGRTGRWMRQGRSLSPVLSDLYSEYFTEGALKTGGQVIRNGN
jgi:hypothetical protein